MPRRSARVAAAVEAATSALVPLPLPLVLRIFRLLPLDARCKAAWVCRGWRTVLLAERSLWTTLSTEDLDYKQFAIPVPMLLSAQRLAAAADCGVETVDLSRDAVLRCATDLEPVVRACAATLRELVLPPRFFAECARLHELLFCAPLDALQVLRADVSVHTFQAAACLRRDPPFGVLRMRGLQIVAVMHDLGLLAPDFAAHDGLEELWLCHAHFEPGSLRAVVDAVHAGGLTCLKLDNCDLGDSAAADLARLLGAGGALTTLELRCNDPPVLDMAGAATLAEALRANSTLTSLSLRGPGFGDDVDICAALLRGVERHPTLQHLRVRPTMNFYEQSPFNAAGAATLGRALGAVLACDAPALRELNVSDALLGAAGLRPLLGGLQRNTHLWRLDVARNGASDPLVRSALLPAVRACESLQQLRLSCHHTQPSSAVAEAQGLVWRRGWPTHADVSLEEAANMARVLNCAATFSREDDE